jgi:LacI family transcriptional regulator
MGNKLKRVCACKVALNCAGVWPCASEGLGLHAATAAVVLERLRQWPQVSAVYSIGGANAANLQAFAQAGRACKVFIGHDLAHDMRMACLHLMRANGVGPKQTPATLSGAQEVTPFNVPV